MQKFLLATAAAALFAPAVNAATITQSESFASQGTDWALSASFDQFDSSLGTLDSVVFDLTGNVTGTASAEQLGGASDVTLELDATITSDLAGFGELGVVIPAASDTIALDAFDGEFDFDGPSGVTFSDLSGSDTISNTFTSGLAPFIGTGSFVVPTSAEGGSGTSGSGNVVTQFSSSASADLTLTYNYTESSDVVSPVPLPAAGWAMIAALGALGAVARRRTKA